MCEPGNDKKLLCLFPNDIGKSNKVLFSDGETIDPAREERNKSNMYICLGKLPDTSESADGTDEIPDYQSGSGIVKKQYDYKVCKIMFAHMIYHRINTFPGEYKLFPDDIKFLAYIRGIVWTPFIDVKNFVKSIFSDNDLGGNLRVATEQTEPLDIDSKYNKIVVDYYNNIPNICYEYLSRVLPIFSLDDTCYIPKMKLTFVDRLLTFAPIFRYYWRGGRLHWRDRR